MDVRVLGPLIVRDQQGGEVAVPGARLRSLLMLLCVHEGASVTADRLIEELWRDDQPKMAANALQVLVSKLRRTLGAGGSRVVTTGNGYRLELGADGLDIARFEAAAARGRALLADGDIAGASEVLAEALSWWRGDPFDGATEGVLHDAAVRLHAVRLNALEDRFDAELQAGRHADVVEELRRSVTDHPTRERFHGLLMLALYRCGRQADALRAFAAAREFLLDELGIDPGAELRELEMMILNQDPRLKPDEAHGIEFASNLPHSVGSFIGRVDDVEQLASSVEQSRLVTVVAPGGAGKTRTSIEVAHRWVGRCDVWFVDLAPLARDGSIIDAIAATIGCEVGDRRSGPAGTLDRLVDHLARRPTLLLIDNCEHVIQQVAFAVDRLVRDCGELRILATSREALRVNGETVSPLQPMTKTDGVALFVECARRMNGAVELDHANVSKVAELCRRLDGIPLAIELAASRTGSLTVGQILDRLDDRFRVLNSGARTAMPRHQTLRAVVEWSYQMLSDAERRVFDRLSVFAGGFTLEAAEQVTTDDLIAEHDVADLLTQLVAKSLVWVDRSEGGLRYRMLHTLLLYGREQLTASGEQEGLRSRHASHFAGLCARGPAAFRGVDQIGWLDEVRREIDNLHDALSWTLGAGDAALGHRMLAGLGPGWFYNGRAAEGWRWLRRGLDSATESPAAVRADLATYASYLGLQTGLDPAEAHRVSELAVALSRQTAQAPDGIDRLALSLMAAGRRALFDGDPVSARACWNESRDLYATQPDGWSRAMTAHMAARLAALEGRDDDAYAAFRQATELCAAHGIWWGVAVLASDAGDRASTRGEHDEAVRILTEGLRAAALVRLSTASAVLTSQLAATYMEAGKADLADRLSLEAVRLADEADTSFGRTLALTNRARVAIGLGRVDLGLEAAAAAVAVAEEAGMPSLALAPRRLIDGMTSPAERVGDPA